MKFYQKWQGCTLNDDKRGEMFPVSVPGNIQKDYAAFAGWGDINYMKNCLKYIEIEDYHWLYEATLDFEVKENERVFFVTHGIEYQYDVLLDGQKLVSHEGMYTRVEIDITDKVKKNSVLGVHIYPHPKREGAPANRDQADQSCKPAVEYGWDWHPRTLVSGLWDETYIETRDESYIGDVEVSYKLSKDMTRAEVHFEIDCQKETSISLFAPDGELVYSGTDRDFVVDNPLLWWCNGYGEPNLYSWRVTSTHNEKSGRVGFRKVRLVMAEGAWFKPLSFPKGRNDAPATIELNGKHIFAKGSNWVNPEVFTATISDEAYYNQVKLAKEANMNIFRCWGGAIIDKEAFFDACDMYGIMVWQEYPLACNNYLGTPNYLKILEQEARAIARRVRRHACHVLWCGGNELFNGWSKMTDQSHALRLLDKISYEEDFSKPFIMTSPLNGMAHGGYYFYEVETERSVFEIFRCSDNTAYTEFGVPSIASMEQLKTIFDEKTLNNPVAEPGSEWVLHHGFRAWRINSWCCFDTINMYFGKPKTLADYVKLSQTLQCEGYKCIFEEARRQQPYCGMAINWDYNEPWRTAAGNNLIEYPSNPKPSYYAVKQSLRPLLPSMRFYRFDYKPGDTIEGELWLLNDTFQAVSDKVEVYFTVNGEEKHILTWETGLSDTGKNIKGHKVSLKVPNGETQLMTVTLKAGCGESEYKLLLDNKKPEGEIFVPELNN